MTGESLRNMVNVEVVVMPENIVFGKGSEDY